MHGHDTKHASSAGTHGHSTRDARHAGAHADDACRNAHTCTSTAYSNNLGCQIKEARNTKTEGTHDTEVKEACRAKVGETGAKIGVTDSMVCKTDTKVSRAKAKVGTANHKVSEANLNGKVFEADAKVSKAGNNAGESDARVKEDNAEVSSVRAQRPLAHCSTCSTSKHVQDCQAGRCSRWTSPAWQFGAEEANRKSAAQWQKRGGRKGELWQSQFNQGS